MARLDPEVENETDNSRIGDGGANKGSSSSFNSPPKEGSGDKVVHSSKHEGDADGLLSRQEGIISGREREPKTHHHHVHTHGSTGKLLFCALGVFVSFSVFGIFQERM